MILHELINRVPRTTEHGRPILYGGTRDASGSLLVLELLRDDARARLERTHDVLRSIVDEIDALCAQDQDVPQYLLDGREGREKDYVEARGRYLALCDAHRALKCLYGQAH